MTPGEFMLPKESVLLLALLFYRKYCKPMFYKVLTTYFDIVCNRSITMA